jgi:hypothetical protein
METGCKDTRWMELAQDLTSGDFFVIAILCYLRLFHLLFTSMG